MDLHELRLDFDDELSIEVAAMWRGAAFALGCEQVCASAGAKHVVAHSLDKAPLIQLFWWSIFNLHLRPVLWEYNVIDHTKLE